MEVMSKCRFTVIRLLALLAAVPMVTSARAEPIPELAPARVIRLADRRSPETVPVISGVALVPPGRVMATVGDDHLVRLWDTATGQEMVDLSGHNDWVRCVAVSPSGQLLATACTERHVVLWDTSTGRATVTLPDAGEAVRALAFCPDGHTLAAGGFEDRIRLYDSLSGEAPRLLEAPGPDIRAVVFSPDCKQLAAAGREGRVRIWDVASGQLIHELEGHRRRVCALAYSPDGRKLASAGEGPDLLVWDAEGGSLLSRLPVRPGKVLSTTFCGPDRLAAGDSFNTIRLWDLSTGRPLYRLVGHTGSVATLAWDPEAEVLISGSFDTTVRVWPLGSGAIEAGVEP